MPNMEASLYCCIGTLSLLSAEKYTVPYPESVLLDVFINARMSADVVRFSVRGGLASAYCILARPLDSSELPSSETVEVAFKKAWEQLERQALAQYSNRREVSTIGQYRQLLQQMTTISSIGAWQQGLWRAQRYRLTYGQSRSVALWRRFWRPVPLSRRTRRGPEVIPHEWETPAAEMCASSGRKRCRSATYALTAT